MRGGCRGVQGVQGCLGLRVGRGGEGRGRGGPGCCYGNFDDIHLLPAAAQEPCETEMGWEQEVLELRRRFSLEYLIPENYLLDKGHTTKKLFSGLLGLLMLIICHVLSMS